MDDLLLLLVYLAGITGAWLALLPPATWLANRIDRKETR